MQERTYSYSEAARAEIAAMFDGYADGLLEVADQLEADGYEIAAEIQREGAAMNREVADAARESSERLDEVFNG
ncbi:hypothetical protein ACFV6G_41920 [Streptomyces lavendulae]|uniref:hypothetical protein n=1 Tax=Streptomyces lavendulae TaxID=1914 RepID=UPI0031EDAB1A